MSDIPVVEISGLGVSFSTDAGPVKAVDGVSLSVAPREVLAIVGESGSGKTVTARAIIDLLPETATASGVVLLRTGDGGSLNVLQASAEQIREARGTGAAMVFQEPTAVLNPVFTVGWQIIEGLRAHGGRDKKDLRQKAIDILDAVGIPDPHTRVDYYPHQFSGGQKQRVVIAMALVLNPGLIIADEPTTALDVTVQAEILELLRRCRDDFGTAIVLITHNMGVVADLSDRVAVMYQGTVIEQGDVASIFAHPAAEYTQKLLAAVPRIGQHDARTPVLASAPVVVEAVELTVEYPGRLGRPGFRAVDSVSFSIREGEVLGLVGESGSGKTTIGRTIAGLTTATGGALRVLGQEVRGLSARKFRQVRADIGFVFQDPGTSFNPQLTIAECVAEPLIVHKRAQNVFDARPRVDELLEAVQLPASYGDRYPHELSGGQRQRASLARGLALNPKLLIADEPTSALDVSVQARVLDLFRELQQEFSFACLFITHDLAVVDSVAHSIAVLYRGNIVEAGSARSVLTEPQHPYTQRLIASLPVPDPIEQAARREAFLRLDS